MLPKWLVENEHCSKSSKNIVIYIGVNSIPRLKKKLAIKIKAVCFLCPFIAKPLASPRRPPLGSEVGANDPEKSNQEYKEVRCEQQAMNEIRLRFQVFLLKTKWM